MHEVLESTSVERRANADGVAWILAAVRSPAPRARRAPSRRGGAFGWAVGEGPRRPSGPAATSHPTGPGARFPPPASADSVPPAAADSFPHARHTRIACLVCHQTGAREGRLTFERPRGCQICHHQAPREAKCETCHQPNEYAGPAPATLTVTVSGHPPRPRSVDFVHAEHAERPCLECHSTPVSLAPPPGKAQCTECHVEHHAVGQSCSSCHRVEKPGLAHATLEVAHQRCDACHVRATVEQLTPTRDFCGTCHVPLLVDHYEPRECTVCHFLAEPSRYQVKLTTAQTR